jgi:hypothetical protein
VVLWVVLEVIGLALHDDVDPSRTSVATGPVPRTAVNAALAQDIVPATTTTVLPATTAPTTAPTAAPAAPASPAAPSATTTTLPKRRSWPPGPTAAASDTGQLTITPASGPNGTRIAVFGTRCAGLGYAAYVELYDGKGSVYDSVAAMADSQGSWSLELRAIGMGPGPYEVGARCVDSSAGQAVGIWEYAPVSFTLT